MSPPWRFYRNAGIGKPSSAWVLSPFVADVSPHHVAIFISEIAGKTRTDTSSLHLLGGICVAPPEDREQDLWMVKGIHLQLRNEGPVCNTRTSSWRGNETGAWLYG